MAKRDFENPSRYYIIFKMSFTALLISGALTFGAQSEDSPVDFATNVQKSIDSFRQAWLPKQDDLSGLVVVIDPALGGQPTTRRADDMSLMAGEHLYHLVRLGGGIPILTRADDQPIPGASAGLESALREYLACTRGHLLVRIECGSHKKFSSSGDAVRSPLSTPLADALGKGTKGKSEPLTMFKVPSACITFEPGPQTEPIRDRQHHREIAESLYHGLAAFATAHRSEILQTRLAAFPTSGESECHSVPLYPNMTNEQKRRNFARQIWPSGPLPADRADWFCQLYARLRLSNRTLIYFEPHVERQPDGTLFLTGSTTDRQLSHGLVKALRSVDLHVEDHMKLLPSEEALGQKLFGVCKVTTARTFAQPVESSVPQTQVLYGEPLFLLDKQNGYTLALANDGYWGWMRDEAVEPMTAEQFNAYNTTRLGVLLQDVANGNSILHRGTKMPLRPQGAPGGDGASARKCSLTLPGGHTLSLSPDLVREVDGMPAAQERVLGALRLLYTPYVFGARSPIGLDCSGMVAYLGELTSLSPARDAAQQALSGRLVATRWYRSALKPGDQIYFMDEGGKIFHTGIALNSDYFIHCSPPEVQISCLNPGDRLYNPHWDETFFIAKRP